MKLILIVLTLVFYTSCSSHKKNNSVSLTSAQKGFLTTEYSSFPIYLSDKIEKRSEIEEKAKSKDVYIIHTGHFLKSSNSKEQNENILKSFQENQTNLINLTLEDISIIESQKIDLEKFNSIFLNTTVHDLSTDRLYSKKNVTDYVNNENIAFLGLSDKNIEAKLKNENFIIDDYVITILKTRKTIQKNSPDNQIKTFIIIHTLGDEMNQIMLRLPPSFINSMAN